MSDHQFTRRLENQFPRSTDLPTQSSKFWAKEKDRYIRQQLIADIERESGRETIVYFAQLDQQISHADPDDLSEIIDGLQTKDIDLVLQTPGGLVDAVEKVVTVLRGRLNTFRVIVPSWAKSGGTVIAMSADSVLLGVNSELGPIDPQINLQGIGPVSAEIVANDASKDATLRAVCNAHVLRMRALAGKILESRTNEKGVRSFNNDQVQEIIKKISSASTYMSHGAVIDYAEAKELGFNVEWMDADSLLWKRIWLLYCCYDHDLRTRRLAKVIEGACNSIAKPLPVSSP